MVSVYWTTKAQRALRAALAGRLGSVNCHACSRAAAPRRCSRKVRNCLALLKGILAGTFPKAKAVIVQDRFQGYRPTAAIHVLLVEVLGAKRPGPYIVKIGAKREMINELNGWRCCRLHLSGRDQVFLPLKPGFRDGGLMSLIYGNAQQFIGVESISFEKALLQSVYFGYPQASSICHVLLELYERLGHLLYRHWYVDDPARPRGDPTVRPRRFVFYVRHLAEVMRHWEENPRLHEIRCEADAAKHGPGSFVDPLDYLHYVQSLVRWRDDEGNVHKPKPAVSAPGQPSPAQLVPRMLRGQAHGDLHGRNILVGIVDGRALWPAVFDYEDMGVNNLIGWDFVKLETELKIRAYAELFRTATGPGIMGGAGPRFVTAVQKFEMELNEATEDYHQSGSWPSPRDAATPLERLHDVLIELRHMACLHMGIKRHRPTDWLEEYYFILLCYGICTGRFPNLHRREKLATYVAAGVTASRLNWPRVQLPRERLALGM